MIKRLVLFIFMSSAVFSFAAEKPAAQARQEMEARSAGIYTDAMNASNQAARYAFEQLQAGKKEYAKAARVLTDCAEVAGVAAAMTARKSPIAQHCREALAKCCDVVAAECEKLNDPAFKTCVESCRKAAQDCRDIQQLSMKPEEKQ